MNSEHVEPGGILLGVDLHWSSPADRKNPGEDKVPEVIVLEAKGARMPANSIEGNRVRSNLPLSRFGVVHRLVGDVDRFLPPHALQNHTQGSGVYSAGRVANNAGGRIPAQEMWIRGAAFALRLAESGLEMSAHRAT
jgi:hypothetical protein